MSGQGTKQLANGDSYAGAWLAGKACGWGEKRFACGDHHRGFYEDDKRHRYWAPRVHACGVHKRALGFWCTAMACIASQMVTDMKVGAADCATSWCLDDDVASVARVGARNLQARLDARSWSAHLGKRQRLCRRVR